MLALRRSCSNWVGATIIATFRPDRGTSRVVVELLVGATVVPRQLSASPQRQAPSKNRCPRWHLVVVAASASVQPGMHPRGSKWQMNRLRLRLQFAHRWQSCSRSLTWVVVRNEDELHAHPLVRRTEQCQRLRSLHPQRVCLHPPQCCHPRHRRSTCRRRSCRDIEFVYT